MATGTPWEPNAMALKYTVSNKTSVEIQILYLECQWKPHKSIFFNDAGMNKYYRILYKMHMNVKGCAHIASTESTKCPEPRNQGGMIGHPIREIWGEH